jgi:hypothetical protein
MPTPSHQVDFLKMVVYGHVQLWHDELRGWSENWLIGQSVHSGAAP